MSAGADPGRVRELFDALCDLPQREQLARLDHECGDDPALREELLSLLEHDAQSDDLFSESQIESQRDALREPTPQRGTPDRIGPFKVIRRIGDGGMGDVFEAEQETPRRRVAIKVMHTGANNDRLTTRFAREAQILASLRHPGIAQLYVSGLCTIGRAEVPYFAMELIEGRPLSKYLRTHPLSTADRVALVIDICDAVSFAHSKGVIHRDLKPDNILIENTDAGPMPKILDFGVAKLSDVELQVATMQTEIGQLIGTLTYMSPEQIAGDPGAIDERTDVHALGLILYETLSGSRPFDLTGKPIHEAARVIREDEPTSLSAVDRALRGDLDTIAQRALEKDPSRRYQSAADLASDLRRYLENKPIVARPPTTLYQLGKFTRRNKALVGGVTATFLALLVGLVGTTWFAIDSAAKQREARWQFYRSSIAAASSALTSLQPRTALDQLEHAPEEFRGWEWRHLALLSDRRPQTLDIPPARSVATDPLTPRLVFLTTGGTLESRDLDDPSDTRTLASVVDLAVASSSHTSGTLLAWSRSQGLVLVDLDRDMIARAFGNIVSAPREIVTASNASLAAMHDGRTVSVLDLDSGNIVLSLNPFRGHAWIDADGRALEPDPDAGIEHIAISSDGSTLALTSRATSSNLAAIIETRSGNASLRKEPERPVDPAFSPDGSLVAFTMNVRNIHIYDARTLEPVRVLRAHSGRVNRAVFLDDDRLASIATDGTLREWDARSGRQLDTVLMRTPPERTAQLALAAGARVVHLDARDTTAHSWDLDTAPACRVLRHEDYIYQVAFSPDGSMLAVSPKWGTHTSVWDLATFERVAALPGECGELNGMSFSTDSTILLASKHLGHNVFTMNAWDTTTWDITERDVTPERALDLIGNASNARFSKQHRFSPDGRASAYQSPMIHGEPRVWSMTRDGAQIDTAAAFPDQTQAIDFATDGAWIVTASAEEGAIIWSFPALERLATLHHPTTVMAVCISPDGTRLATGGEDGIVRIWDTERWETVLELHGHTSYVFDLQFSPDGTLLASCSGDATVRIWQTHHGSP